MDEGIRLQRQSGGRNIPRKILTDRSEERCFCSGHVPESGGREKSRARVTLISANFR